MRKIVDRVLSVGSWLNSIVGIMKDLREQTKEKKMNRLKGSLNYLVKRNVAKTAVNIVGIVSGLSLAAHAVEPVEIKVPFNAPVNVASTLSDCNYMIPLNTIDTAYHDLIRNGATYINPDGTKEIVNNANPIPSASQSQIEGYAEVWKTMNYPHMDTSVYNRSCIANDGRFKATAIKWHNGTGELSAQHIQQLSPDSLMFAIYRAYDVNANAITSTASVFGVPDNQNVGMGSASQQMNYALSLEQLLQAASNFYTTR